MRKKRKAYPTFNHIYDLSLIKSFTSIKTISSSRNEPQMLRPSFVTLLSDTCLQIDIVRPEFAIFLTSTPFRTQRPRWCQKFHEGNSCEEKISCHCIFIVFHIHFFACVYDWNSFRLFFLSIQFIVEIKNGSPLTLVPMDSKSIYVLYSKI